MNRPDSDTRHLEGREEEPEQDLEFSALLSYCSDDQLRKMAKCQFRHEMATLDYSPIKLTMLLLDWADNGTVGFDQMTREQLEAHLLDNFQSTCGEETAMDWFEHLTVLTLD